MSSSTKHKGKAKAKTKTDAKGKRDAESPPDLKESAAAPPVTKKQKQGASSAAATAHAVETASDEPMTRAELYPIIAQGLDDVLNGDLTFDQLLCKPIVSRAFDAYMKDRYALPHSKLLEPQTTRINFSKGEVESCAKEHKAAQDLVTQKLIPRMVAWVHDESMINRLRCGFAIADGFKKLDATVPIASALVATLDIPSAAVCLREYRTPGYYFPEVSAVLLKILATTELASLHARAASAIISGMSWYLNRAGGVVEEMGDKAPCSLIQDCIRAVRTVSASMEEEYDGFCKDLLVHLPLAYKTACMEQKLLAPVLKKTLKADMKCISLHQGPPSGETYGEMASVAFAAKKCHEAKTCECYCECSKCWDMVCADGIRDPQVY